MAANTPKTKRTPPAAVPQPAPPVESTPRDETICPAGSADRSSIYGTADHPAFFLSVPGFMTTGESSRMDFLDQKNPIRSTHLPPHPEVADVFCRCVIEFNAKVSRQTTATEESPAMRLARSRLMECAGKSEFTLTELVELRSLLDRALRTVYAGCPGPEIEPYEDAYAAICQEIAHRRLYAELADPPTSEGYAEFDFGTAYTLSLLSNPEKMGDANLITNGMIQTQSAPMPAWVETAQLDIELHKLLRDQDGARFVRGLFDSPDRNPLDVYRDCPTRLGMALATSRHAILFFQDAMNRCTDEYAVNSGPIREEDIARFQLTGMAFTTIAITGGPETDVGKLLCTYWDSITVDTEHFDPKHMVARAFVAQMGGSEIQETGSYRYTAKIPKFTYEKLKAKVGGRAEGSDDDVDADHRVLAFKPEVNPDDFDHIDGVVNARGGLKIAQIAGEGAILGIEETVAAMAGTAAVEGGALMRTSAGAAYAKGLLHSAGPYLFGLSFLLTSVNQAQFVDAYMDGKISEEHYYWKTAGSTITFIGVAGLTLTPVGWIALLGFGALVVAGTLTMKHDPDAELVDVTVDLSKLFEDS